MIMLSALFLAFTAGWSLRGASAGPVRVETQRTLETAQLNLPAPAETAKAGAEKVNINKADAKTLETLPGIGEKRAKDIVDDREKNGPFRYPEDLTRVKGIGEETLAGLIEYITTEDNT